MIADLVEINGGPAILISGAGRPISVLTVDLDDTGRVTAIHAIANPDKLQAVAEGRPRPL